MIFFQKVHVFFEILVLYLNVGVDNFVLICQRWLGYLIWLLLLQVIQNLDLEHTFSILSQGSPLEAQKGLELVGIMLIGND